MRPGSPAKQRGQGYTQMRQSPEAEVPVLGGCGNRSQQLSLFPYLCVWKVLSYVHSISLAPAIFWLACLCLRQELTVYSRQASKILFIHLGLKVDSPSSVS